MADNNNPQITKYTLAGAVFGLIFPILSTGIEIIEHNLPFTVSSFFSEQINNPLLWIIDSAVPILSFLGYQVGIREKKLLNQAQYLEEKVAERSKEILRQKLFYEALVENSPIAIVTLDPDHHIVSINPAFEGIFGYRTEDITGKNLDDLITNSDNKQKAYNITRDVLAGNTIHEFGQRMRKDGTLVDVEIFGEPIEIDGRRIGVLGLYRDITVENSAKQELLASEERFRRMFDDSPVALRLENLSKMKEWVLQKQKETGMDIRTYLQKHPDQFHIMCSLIVITSLNSASLFLFRAKDKQDLQDNYCEILSEESRADKLDIISQLLDGETTIEKEMIYNNLDGKKIYVITKLSILPGSEEKWERVLFSNMDITERKLAEERLAYISLHDTLTGLYNRAFFEEEMTRMGRSRLRPISIFVCDMDNLKKINDVYGHQAGDNVLQYTADIFRKCLRSGDIVARIGGDEFAIILPYISENLAEQLYARIQENIDLHNQSHEEKEQVAISIGYATAHKDDMLEETFKQADTKMYQEKQKKKI